MKNIIRSVMIGNLRIKAKTFDFEERILIGWLANIVREPVNQIACLNVQRFFPDNQLFAKKSSCRVSSEKNILNSSVE